MKLSGTGGGRRASEPSPGSLMPDQVISYERKSNKRKDGTTKSIDDQRTANMETAEEYGLPLLAENQLSEEPGHGGDEFWIGGGGTGLAGDDRTGVRYRPVLTQVMEGVEAGCIKCIIVWSTDRLWRDVAICKMMIDLLGQRGCALYDRNGFIDILTPEGRAAVLQGAIAAQTYRENCAVNSPRGCRSTRNKGKTVVTGNVLGFRHVSKGKVVVVPEEITLVRRIFEMYIGGMSLTDICRALMSEGIVLAPDLYSTHSVKRNEHTHHIIYPKQIRTVLTDCRYQGRQPHEGQEWECKDFLIDGEPAVDPALFEAAQVVLNGKRRTGNAAKRDNYLAGLFKCGLCGQYLALNPSKQADGTLKRFWQAKTSDVQAWCTHSLPNVTERAMCAYIEATLLPWLVAQLDEMQNTILGSAGTNEIVVLRQQIADKEKEFKEQIRKLYAEAEAEGKNAGTAHLTLQEIYDEQIAEKSRRILELEAAAARDRDLLKMKGRVGSSLERWQTLGDNQKKVIIQSVVRWVALLPSEDFASRPKRKGGARSVDRKNDGAPPAGRVAFLTAWNTLHTAVIKRVANPESRTWHRPLGLLPAEIEDCLGTAADLPDPAAFAAGLQRSYDGRGYKYRPFEVLPGYLVNQEVATFDVI